MSNSTISDSDLGWLAGIIDGEGSICATRNNRALPINIQVNIAGSDWRVINRVKYLINKITGEHVAAYQNKAKLNSDGWMVRVSRKRALRKLLPPLLRHLHLKRAQAALALEMASREWSCQGVPPWVEEYGQRIQWFNKHRLRPDGTWYLSGYERTRQSRLKASKEATVRDCTGSGLSPEETVHSEPDKL